MTIAFLINLLLVSTVLMATIALIILREKLDTRIMMSGLFIEAMFALASMLWINPDQLPTAYIVLRIFGRFCESATLWGTVLIQIRGLYKGGTKAGEQPVAYWQERFDKLEAAIQGIAKGDDDDVTH